MGGKIRGQNLKFPENTVAGKKILYVYLKKI